MRRSIRWTLLFWYSSILFIVIAVFGDVLYVQLRHSLQKETDTELRSVLRALAAALQAPGPEVQVPKVCRSFLRRKPPRRKDQREGKAAEKAAAKHPDAYYVVWNQRREVFLASAPGVHVPWPVPPPRRKASAAEWPRRRGPYSELCARGPRETALVVGRDDHKNRDRLRRFLSMVFLAGGGTLALALAGGWFLASRMLAPIDRMTDVALSISDASLSRRIDIQTTENELGRLAGVLNETFDRLESAFQRQARFTADASHELRTPLSVMIAGGELALKRDRDASEYRDVIERCLEAAQRMKTTVEGLLTLARHDAGELFLCMERCDVGSIVSETASLFLPLAEEKKVSLSVHAPSVEFEGDAARLREVVTNLLENAIRHNREGGSVAVTLEGNPEKLVLRVSDTGPGIPIEDQPRVFDRFYRVEKARSRSGGGDGLGLAIVKSIVEAHGGKVSLASTPGKGSTFTVEWPRVGKSERAGPSAGRIPPGRAPGSARN